MPEHIANSDPFKAFTEVIGSGPYTFKASERVPGSRFAYEKFAKYKPRESGEASFTSGPKVVHFDRVKYPAEKARDKIYKAGLPHILGDRLLVGA